VIVVQNALLVNATELLRQPGTERDLRVDVPLADVAVDVSLTSSLDDIVVAGQLRVAWSDECRRCLQPLSRQLVADVEERYAPGGGEDAFPIEHGRLDLAPMVREEVLLAIPDAPLCRPDCAGLCPTCGADLNAGPCGCDRAVRDERWAVLDQLRLED
jgi:uncharacterized protein